MTGKVWCPRARYHPVQMIWGDEKGCHPHELRRVTSFTSVHEYWCHQCKRDWDPGELLVYWYKYFREDQEKWGAKCSELVRKNRNLAIKVKDRSHELTQLKAQLHDSQAKVQSLQQQLRDHLQKTGGPPIYTPA